MPKKLTELDAITSVTADDLIYVVDDPLVTPVSKKITAANFFYGTKANRALFKSYTLTAPEAGYPDAGGTINSSSTTWGTLQKLTDGKISSLAYNDGTWVGWLRKGFYIRLDLETAISGNLFVIVGLESASFGIERPVGIKLEYSDDDSNWSTVEDRTSMAAGSGVGYWVSTFDISASGNHRYWKTTVTHNDAANNYTMVSEIMFLK